MDKDLIDYQEELYNLTSDYKKVLFEYADIKQIYERMEDLKKVTLAKAKNAVERAQSEAARERIAFASDKYITFIEDLSKIRGEYIKSQCKKDAYKNRIDAIITIISSIKEQMRLR